MGNSIEVERYYDVDYIVSAPGYQTQIGTVFSVEENKNINITLLANNRVTLTFNVDPASANIEYDCDDIDAEFSGNTIVANEGSIVAYNISATGYQAFASSAQLSINATANINLLPTGYRAGWTHEEATVYTNSIDPRAGDGVYAQATDGSSTYEVVSITKDVSTGLITDICVNDVTYSRDSSTDTSSL